MIISSNKDKGFVFSPENYWVEDGTYDEGCWKGCIPMVADNIVRSDEMFKEIIDYCNYYDVESNDNEGANGYVCHNGMPDTIEYFASIEDSKEEPNIGRIEENDM